MLLKPKNLKYKKQHKVTNKGFSKNCFYVKFGNYGLKSITRGRINANQIESARKVISKYIKKDGKI